jgi:hypothetical protein
MDSPLNALRLKQGIKPHRRLLSDDRVDSAPIHLQHVRSQLPVADVSGQTDDAPLHVAALLQVFDVLNLDHFVQRIERKFAYLKEVDDVLTEIVKVALHNLSKVGFRPAHPSTVEDNAEICRNHLPNGVLVPTSPAGGLACD